MQSGLTQKWQNDEQHLFKLEAAFKHNRLVKGTKIKINVKHLLGAFTGFGIGLILSLLSFLLEIFSYKIIGGSKENVIVSRRRDIDVVNYLN